MVHGLVHGHAGIGGNDNHRHSCNNTIYEALIVGVGSCI